jgi:hypothetical protein
MTPERLIEVWNDKIPTRCHAENRNMSILLDIANVLDRPSVLMFPSRNSRIRAIELYDVLAERGCFDNVLPESLWPAQT